MFCCSTYCGPGPVSANLVSGVHEVIFVGKYHNTGNFVWGKKFGGTNNECCNAIKLDASGNIYITGYFNNTADFDPGVGTANLTAVSDTDIFIAKYDSSGEYVWAKSIGGLIPQQGNAISIDSVGNIYITGSFQTFFEFIDFDPGVGTGNLESVGHNDIFVAKYDSDGNYIWAKSMGGIEHESSTTIKVDSLGNVYTTGQFYGTTDFDPGAGTANLTSFGDADIFISKLDSSGNYVWAKSIGGADIDNGASLAFDSSNNVYVTGGFIGMVDFDPGAGTTNITSVGNTDIFILKLDSNGNYVWTKQIEGTGHNETGSSIFIDSSDNIYTTGYFNGTADFDPGVGTTSVASVGEYDIFILKLDSEGGYEWVESAGGLSFDTGNSIYVDADGVVYIAGNYKNSAPFDLGGDDIVLTSSHANTTVFLSNLSQIYAPSLTTSPATNTERSTTTLNGEITATGGSNPTIRGFNYGLTTSYGTNTTESGTFSTGTYTSNITNLDCNTTYHYRAYATNSVGTSYGSDSTFTTASCRSSSGSYIRPYVVEAPIPEQQTGSIIPVDIFYRTLKLQNPRMIGSDVKTLQEFLNSKGYTIPQTSYQKTLNVPSPDGVFGPLTKKSVIQFQTANNLVPDGIFGPKTRAKME